MTKALPDTAANAHYIHPDTLPHCSHIVRTTCGPTVQEANSNVIKPDLQATLKMSNKLSPKAQSAHVFNNFTTGSLISMVKNCDGDCIAIFTKFDIKVLNTTNSSSPACVPALTACGMYHYNPAPLLNNHQHVPIQTKPTVFSAITPPNAISPNTSMRKPSALSNIPSSPPSAKANSRHGLVFTQASYPNIFHNPLSR